MRKTVLDAYNAEREVDNITYKNLVVTIASILGFSLLGIIPCFSPRNFWRRGITC